MRIILSTPTEDSATVNGNYYGMSGAIPASQEKRVQFEEDDDDGVYDIAEPRYYQKKTPPPPRPQEAAKIQADCSVTKETIPIEMREGKNRFQVGTFLETPFPLPIWQRLDQSPQSKVQFARTIVSSWSTKGGSIGPNPVGTAAVATKFLTPPAIVPVAHKDKEGYDQLSLKRWTYKVLDWGPGAKTIWGRSIPKILPLMNGQLVRLHGFIPAEIMLVGTSEVAQGVIEEATQGDVNEMEEGPEGFIIERLVDRRDERRTLAVRPILENHTRQEGKPRAQWTQP